MTSVHVYLNFLGNCLEAFTYYQSVFGGQLTDLTRFSEMPASPDQAPIDPAYADQIMHVQLQITDSFILMGSDLPAEWAAGFVNGTNVTLSLNTSSRQEADSLFEALSSEGQVSMPMGDTFWNAYFGMLTDRFGVQWMVSFDQNQQAKA